jgi:hypothetical protein
VDEFNLPCPSSEKEMLGWFGRLLSALEIWAQHSLIQEMRGKWAYSPRKGGLGWCKAKLLKKRAHLQSAQNAGLIYSIGFTPEAK